ncbi:evolutionarily conserved signaling intermediate in Toll pathway, mitochondrial [Pristis pectinata]|uniref:evolutionarily conserved signaling intermediate in Toll pathway, mitochondrial n=1 Tax=Pristis pectinata TaxID=685728 RepID=UPI00223DF1C3|nr:evolutionarily conserved signaling intermediate in Toll pathway, mitochondrial [Pristis pectinata]
MSGRRGLGRGLSPVPRPREEAAPDGGVLRVPHLVGLQSPEQRDLLARHDPRRPVFVEGPFPLWLRRTCLHYYLLRSDPLPPELEGTKPVDPERNLYYPMELSFDLDRDLGDDDGLEVEEVLEGPVFALCQAGSGDAASLSRWIDGLQETNPSLSHTPVVFRTTAAAAAPRRLVPAVDPEPAPSEAKPQDGEWEEEEPGSRRMRR